MREAILEALEKMGVVRAASEDDPLRWSVSDLATDLARLLKGKIVVQAKIGLICGMPYHADDCQCHGEAGDR